MGKLGSPKSPRPVSEMKQSHLWCSESVGGGETFLGRRLSGGDGLKTSVVSSAAAKVVTSRVVFGGKRQNWFLRNLRSIGFTIGMIGLFYCLDSVVFTDFDATRFQSTSVSKAQVQKADKDASSKIGSSSMLMYARLLNLASASLEKTDFRNYPSNPWKEPFSKASVWKPCADRISRDQGRPGGSNGYILVSANGGLNQQRVAVCNAVAVASLLNATLVVPRFLYSSVWKDRSQFGDIYQEEHFINTMKDEITIVKELPSHLQSLDLERIGSLITDAELVKEAKPADYLGLVLPILMRNGVVHLLGYGNRLGFDPLPANLQKLRCKCNFHALKFVPKIQQLGSILVKRLRKYESATNMLDRELFGDFMPDKPVRRHDVNNGPSNYLALHLRFEVDMVAYSFCDFGGGESEKRELQAYRETHFPLLLERLKNLKPVSPAELRISGRCPLTPEEAALVLAGLGLKRGTYIYLAGSQIYGGRSRMNSFTSLYPNLVTKEDLLTPSELEPFRNFSSQLAALDFIACATADVFAMTDSGSQLSSLVSGFRTYFGGGHAPTLRPNKKRLAAMLSRNDTIQWENFQVRVKKMINEGQRVQVRSRGQSIYRLPRSPECMCRSR